MPVALNRALALFTFLALSGVGFYTVLYHVVASGGNEVILEKICPQPPTYKRAPQLHYTGFLIPDAILCNLVAFFKALFVPQNIGYTLHFLGGFAPVSLAYLIEGVRSDCPRAVSPLHVGLGYQLASAAGIMPLAWMALVLSVVGRADRARKPLTRAQAEAVFFGVVVGCVVPTAAMVLLRDDYIIAYWQIFPAYIWVLQHLWLMFRRGASASSSGLSVVRAALITIAATSAIPHLNLLYHHKPSLAAFAQWWPSFSVPERSTTTLYTAAAHLIRWDSIIWYTSSIAAAAFLTESASEALTTLAIASVASIIASPGAAIALLWLRREEKLVKAQKTSKSAGVPKDRKKRRQRKDNRDNGLWPYD